MYLCATLFKIDNSIIMAKAKKKNTKVEETDKLDKFTKSALGAPGKFITIMKADSMQVILGLICMMVAIYMLFTFTSFIFTGAEDQSAVESMSDEAMANEHGEISNHGGSLGAKMAFFLMNRCFGFAAYFIPVFLFVWGLKLVRAYDICLWKWFFSLFILMFWFSVLLGFIATNLFDTSFLRPGGDHGAFISTWTINHIGVPGLLIALFTIALAFLIFVSKETINIIRKALHPERYIHHISFTTKVAEGNDTDDEDEGENDVEGEENVATSAENKNSVGTEQRTAYTPEPEDPAVVIQQPPVVDEPEVEEEGVIVNDQPTVTKPAVKPLPTDPNFGIEAAAEIEVAEKINQKPYDPRLDLENYKFPTVNLLKDFGFQKIDIDQEEQNANKNKIIRVLHSFGVEIDSIQATVGPTITLYEITPAEGVRISKIKNLEDDIALSLAALGIRIIAPIPGKGTIGIEVPNKNAQIVPMRDIINSRKFQESKFELPIAFGKTITNDVFMVDLAKAPHMLVAGATGQGKSVGLNAVVTSLLYKKHPAELKFVIIDPKKVEFGIYAPIEKHYLAKLPDNEEAIITDVDKVVATLKSLCQEMDDRYDLLKRAGVRNIKEYNEKFINRKLNPEKEVPMTHKRDYPVYHHYLPYIVTIIDEYGDLMMTAGKEVEVPICRLAQLARAIGIHCIIATQRPTASIVTGNIKTNFPARVAFRVSSMMDSRVILDRGGAHQLVGRGDMLYLGGTEPVRVQCAFVDTPEVEAINTHIASQQGYISAFELHPVHEEGDEDAMTPGEVNMKELDPMFREAATLVVTYQQGSTSLIQRKFAIGYNRAGRLMDQLERAGIVGAANGSKARDVLCPTEQDLEMKLESLGLL